MKNIAHIIKSIEPESIASELDLEPGDQVLKVNASDILDVFDYQYLINDEYIELLVEKANGEQWLLEIEKGYDEDLGITFESNLMDEYHSCSNKCIFCFIDQLPKGMRSTLYFKDDDSRLSFLQGNYVTMTNMKDADVDRLIKYKLSPINISVHTMNPKLRCEMLNNRFAGRLMGYMQRLYDHEMIMNAQIVLCKDVNDREELEYSISELSKFIPYMQSVSVVPIGVTKYREGLHPVKTFEKEDAKAVLAQIHRWQERLYEEYHTHFIHAGDEWYILADEPVPEADRYDGYLQLENGVGMVRLLLDEFEEALAQTKPLTDTPRQVSIVTGVSASQYIKMLANHASEKYPQIQPQVHVIQNDFFGPKITVSGLLTGQDIINQLSGKALGETLLLPCNLLRSGEQVLLDDVTVEDIENALQVPVTIVQSNGQDLVNKLLGR